MIILCRTVAFTSLLLAVGCAGEKQPGATGDTGRVAPVAAAASSAPTVTERGIGPLQAGMTVAEAAAAIGGTLIVPAGADSAGCDYVEWRGGPAGVHVMVEGGRIARVDVDSAGVRTVAGAGVGDTEEQVQRLYGGRAAMSPHKYEDGHYLTLIDAADSSFALVFETGAGKVTRYRAGRRPAVEYVEGCS